MIEQTVVINGVTYVRADSVPVPRPTGSRAVVVVDRGWIFAGDARREDGRIFLSRAILVFKWEEVGFDGMLSNPLSPKVFLRPLENDVEIPAGSEICSVPVSENWGLK